MSTKLKTLAALALCAATLPVHAQAVFATGYTALGRRITLYANGMATVSDSRSPVLLHWEAVKPCQMFYVNQYVRGYWPLSAFNTTDAEINKEIKKKCH